MTQDDPAEQAAAAHREAVEAIRRRKVERRIGGVVSSLSTMMRTYVIEVLVTNNQTEAADRAGYAHPAQAGSRLAKNPKVVAAIDDYFRKQEMSVERVVALLSEQAEGSYTDYIDASGAVDLAGLKRDGLMHLVKGTKETQWGLVVEFHDAYQARVQIGRYHGIFGPSGSTDDPVHSVGWTVEEWRAERDRRRTEAAETEALFKDDLATEDDRSADLGKTIERNGLAAED